MGWMDSFKFKSVGSQQGSVFTAQDVEHLKFPKKFSEQFSKTLYQKIMFECSARAVIPPDVSHEGYTFTVSNSYTPAKMGVVSILVDAMVTQEHIFLRAVPISTDAKYKDMYRFDRITQEEAFTENSQGEKHIKGDCLEVDFSDFFESEMIALLFELMREIMVSSAKGVRASQALLLKMHKMSEMIANEQNMQPFVQQTQQLNEYIRKGKLGFIDGESDLGFITYDSEPNAKAIDLILGLVSAITGLPKSWIFGEVVTGLGSGDNGDEERANSAIKRYYNNIYSGMLYSIYNKAFPYKPPTKDTRELSSMFAFIESSSRLTEEAKNNFLINHAGFTESDFKEVDD